ncbi:lymphocyte antigen 86 isoform X2 [Hyla sarda]|uniref:lymphocyte antigen 86 isoform X2 n=1 Tax=Hyla sarda TaxID=327740 RepID=UPI0024C41872|nr:lymphocyte antigen 86 isoform X2 [Hyla sarda]
MKSSLISVVSSPSGPCHHDDFFQPQFFTDPLQDVGISFNPCSRNLKQNIIAKVGLILRQDVNLLYSNTKIYYKGTYLFHEEKPLCEKTAPQFSFCGKKKGEFIFYNHSVRFGISSLPKGEYLILLEFVNEQNYKIACVNFTVYSNPLD